MRSTRLKKWAAGAAVASAGILLAGCTPNQTRGFLPEGSEGATNHTDSIIGLWTTSWIVLLVVGVIAWSLVIWATIAYRRRKGETGVPVQLRYNMPIETLFTVIPVILIIGFFAFTAKTQSAIEEPIANPDNRIEVIGKRWAWDFNYTDENVHFSGVQVQTDQNGSPTADTMPTLYLPVNKSTEVKLESRDVIHSFWVVEYLYKKDMIPGKTNYMYFTPTKTGTFVGKCAELCGEYHSNMLFQVKVVEQDEYDAYIASLAANPENQGLLSVDYNPNQNLPGTSAPEGH
ncbi:cytochrome c oxidase subunit II [Canibacter zhoujuaniae]|uniref:aa3-type cytochrome oxidase subunit II n=1 Tax=Canibacter zhoujuaniae TaxID=2708343 RepID=UPI001421EAFF|nr:cytochrome c oxidase subunit II [Canibacter zhoujuaniae]